MCNRPPIFCIKKYKENKKKIKSIKIQITILQIKNLLVSELCKCKRDYSFPKINNNLKIAFHKNMSN